MTRTAIATDGAPAAIGPYSQAVRVGGLIFTAGQIPLDPATRHRTGGITEQVTRVFENLKAILEEGRLPPGARRKGHRLFERHE